MNDRLFYYLWHAFCYALMLGVALNAVGLLPVILVKALVYALMGVAGGVLLRWVLRLFVG